MGVFFILVSFFHGLLELGGHFFGDFGVLGSSLDAFGARGVQGGDLVEIVRSRRALLASFWTHFWSNTMMFLRCFVRCFFEWIVYGF